MQEYKGSPALDAGLLAAAQAVEYYQISRYGTLRTRAEEFGLDDTASLFRETPSGLLRAFFSDSPTREHPVWSGQRWCERNAPVATSARVQGCATF
jgi:hypothetical protein